MRRFLTHAADWTIGNHELLEINDREWRRSPANTICGLPSCASLATKNETFALARQAPAAEFPTSMLKLVAAVRSSDGHNQQLDQGECSLLFV